MSKVSIIIPVFNTQYYIEKCLTSVVNQTLKDIEIIVIDDGSSDDSIKIAKEFQESDDRIKIITQEHKKQGAARNNGIDNAQGEYIGFVDSDDWVDLDYFEKLYNSAAKFNCDIALATNVRTGNGKTKKRLNIKSEKAYFSTKEKFDICDQLNNECPTNKIYKKSLLEKYNIKWPEDVFCEDKIFTVKCVFYANGIATAMNTNYYYYRNPFSTVNNKTNKHLKPLLRDKNNAKKSVLKFLREKDVKFADKKYWAIKEEIKIFSIPFITIKESVFTKRVYLFSFVLIFECAL